MVNEFVYCPRLFYYEHVEGVFVESEDTLRGTTAHRRVNKGRGELPAPASRREPQAGDALPAPATGADTARTSEEDIIHSRSRTQS
jgi:CRISPR-associated protein Cas1